MRIPYILLCFVGVLFCAFVATSTLANGTAKPRHIENGKVVAKPEGVQTATLANGSAKPRHTENGKVEVKHEGVQLWKNGPYWATTNIGAEKPEDYGYYFWWGDTVGYKLENYVWVASDGSSSDFWFAYHPISKQTEDKTLSTLVKEGWVVPYDYPSAPIQIGGILLSEQKVKAGLPPEYMLAPEQDAAQVQWGDGWRMPPLHALVDLVSDCDWTCTTRNGVNGHVVRGKGDFAANSIFLPSAGFGVVGVRSEVGSSGVYWSSTPKHSAAGEISAAFGSRQGNCDIYFINFRSVGFPIRPVKWPKSVKDHEEDANMPVRMGGKMDGSAADPFDGLFASDERGGIRRSDAKLRDGATGECNSQAAKGKGNHEGVQLWENGPYWATTNIGAEKPEDYGYCFWWGDTVGYKRKKGAWVASDGSSSDFKFCWENTPTYTESISDLLRSGWIFVRYGRASEFEKVQAFGILAPEHDAAHVQWGGGWRMPTSQECDGLFEKCDWKLKRLNGVAGYVVKGRYAYAGNSIFLPFEDADGYKGSCWSSDTRLARIDDGRIASSIYFSENLSSYPTTELRYNALAIRPVKDGDK